jgi:LacI family transcriptional regulator
VIVLIIPDVENPFSTSAARSVEDQARAVSHSVLLCSTDEDPARS